MCNVSVKAANEFKTLTLIHPTSNWTHWATLRCHPCLSKAATSASSPMNHIFCKSLLTVLFQFSLGQPGPLLYPASTVPAVVCADGPYTEHLQTSKVVFLSVCCP